MNIWGYPSNFFCQVDYSRYVQSFHSFTLLWRQTRPSRTNAKKDVLFIIGDWNEKVGSQEIPGVTGKFGLGVQNEAGEGYFEFCLKYTVVIAKTLFQQNKRRLYTWTLPDGQYWNQTDYIPCSQRWRRRQWHPTPVLSPGKSHGWRSLVGCSPWGRWGSDMTEPLHFDFLLSCIGEGNGNPLQCSCLEKPRDGGAW